MILVANSIPMKKITVIDSHTGGEPTRVVVSGGPDLGGGTMAERLAVFRDQFDRYRSAIVNEPRGSDVLVGALLCEPVDRSCAAGVIFFNNVGYLGMCGHGTIGLIVTLAHLDRIKPGEHRIETPVGVVTATLHDDGAVSVQNVNSYRKARGVEVDLGDTVPKGFPRKVSGDVAWGGNWFYLVEDHGQGLEPANIEALTDFSWAIRRAINAQGHPEVDHVELIQTSGSSRREEAPSKAQSGVGNAELNSEPLPPGGIGDYECVSRTFVLCPGKAYDRSPCGTGTSAKLACLAADGKLAEGEKHVVESIIGSRFVGEFRWVDQAKGIIAPTVTGTAHITAEATLLIDERDLYGWGIGS